MNKLVETCKLEPVLDWELGDQAVKGLAKWSWGVLGVATAPVSGRSVLVGVGSAGGGFNGWSQGAVESP